MARWRDHGMREQMYVPFQRAGGVLTDIAAEPVTAVAASAIASRHSGSGQGPAQFGNSLRSPAPACHLFQSGVPANDTEAITQASAERTVWRSRRRIVWNRRERECREWICRSDGGSSASVFGFHRVHGG